jgi:flagellar biosynthesis protein FliP
MKNPAKFVLCLLLLLCASSGLTFAAGAALPDFSSMAAATGTPAFSSSNISTVAPTVTSIANKVDPNEIRITGVGSGSAPWSIVVLLTLLTLIPALLLSVTPFARLLVVFHFLRQALGLQTTPTNQTLIGLALVLTFFLMQPVGAAVYQTSVMPMQDGRITAMQAVERAADPLRGFMVHYVREKDDEGAGPRLHRFRTEHGISDWHRFVPALPGDRHGGRVDFNLGGNVAVASGCNFHAVEAAAFRDGGWLEPADWFANEKF